MNVRNALSKIPAFFTAAVMSPRIITGVGVVVALVQLAAAIESFNSSAKSRKRIGFNE